MKLYARFPTVLRGKPLDAELTGIFDPPNLVEVEIHLFNKDGAPAAITDLTRQEIAYLCREAGRSKQQ